MVTITGKGDNPSYTYLLIIFWDLGRLGGGFKMFQIFVIFTTTWEWWWSNLTTAHIFQMGWFNHQLVDLGSGKPTLFLPNESCHRRRWQIYDDAWVLWHGSSLRPGKPRRILPPEMGLIFLEIHRSVICFNSRVNVNAYVLLMVLFKWFNGSTAYITLNYLLF